MSRLIPNFDSANADMKELIGLSCALEFDLYEFLRLLSEAGASPMTCEIDEARPHIARYELSPALQVILVAMRKRHLHG